MSPIPKSLKFLCPKCQETYEYSAIEYKFAKEDGCCHECVPEDAQAEEKPSFTPPGFFE